MEIKTAEFVISNTDPKLCPEPKYPEYAFIGRSNVGKSSLINMLTNNNKLAKTSQTPGKTQLINHFVINENFDPWFLVDLPGYGYAKAPKKEKNRWQGFITTYLKKRENLMCVMVLLDSRHEAQKKDLEFMEWLGENSIPFVMVFTKADKLSSAQLNKNLLAYKKEMLKYWEFLPDVFTTSATAHKGKDAILKYIEKINVGFSR
ncbi:ribosome biogenesis GTP-binding protein YihA/YsxC [Halocola ammonii]